MKKIIILLILLSTIYSFSQDSKTTNKILNSYIQKLKLKDTQISEFTAVYNEYKTTLNSDTIENNVFNKFYKERDLKIRAILTKEQSITYRKISKELEPNISYRM